MPTGRPSPGSVVIRAWVPREFWTDLSVAATYEGLTLSQYLVQATRREMGRTNRRRRRERGAA